MKDSVIAYFSPLTHHSNMYNIEKQIKMHSIECGINSFFIFSKTFFGMFFSAYELFEEFLCFNVQLSVLAAQFNCEIFDSQNECVSLV